MALFDNALTTPSPLEKTIQTAVRRFRLPEEGEERSISRETREDWLQLYAIAYTDELPLCLHRISRSLVGMPVAKTCEEMLRKHLELQRGRHFARKYDFGGGFSTSRFMEEQAHWIRQSFNLYRDVDSLLLVGALLAFQLEIGIPWLIELTRPEDISVYADIGRYITSFNPNSHDAGDIFDLVMAVEDKAKREAALHSADDKLLALTTAETIFAWCLPPSRTKGPS